MQTNKRIKAPITPYATLVAMNVLAFLAGCTSGEPGSTNGSPSAGPLTPLAAAKLAQSNLLPAYGVTPAPPGDTLIDGFGPVLTTANVAEPSRQVMTCTPLELPSENQTGPAEPDAVGAAASGFVTGVAQVDQYAVVYRDEAAAERAVTRSRGRADNCDAAFRVHSPNAKARATVTAAPPAVTGFRVHATYEDKTTGHDSDEVSAVMRAGLTVLYLRTNESSTPGNSLLDEAWADSLIKAAAAHLAG